MVRALVEAGAVIDSPNKWGETALELGFDKRQVEILLKAGAQLSETTFDRIRGEMGEDFALNFKVAYTFNILSHMFRLNCLCDIRDR